MIFFVFRARFGAVLFVLCILGFMLLETCKGAHSETLSPPGTRTASWYAAHPQIMRRILDVCRDDPGHGDFHPDCMNARAGELLQAEAIARRNANLPTLISPRDPNFWFKHADLMPQQRLMCSRMNAEDRRRAFCDASDMADRRAFR